MRYAQPLQSSPYQKNEMAPPVRAAGEVNQNIDAKHHVAEEPEVHDHDSEYTHSTAPYESNRGTYAYNPNQGSGAIHSEQLHSSPDLTGSASHQNASGRATPRSAANAQTQWTTEYGQPQRTHTAPAKPYSVTDRNGAIAGDAYSAQPTYASPPYPNGLPASNKRIRELDDDETDQYGRDASGNDIAALKRRRTGDIGTVGGAVGGGVRTPPIRR